MASLFTDAVVIHPDNLFFNYRKKIIKFIHFRRKWIQLWIFSSAAKFLMFSNCIYTKYWISKGGRLPIVRSRGPSFLLLHSSIALFISSIKNYLYFVIAVYVRKRNLIYLSIYSSERFRWITGRATEEGAVQVCRRRGLTGLGMT